MKALKTKQRILVAAEEIMAEKGLSATISAIASRSGIKDSVIYHYFKNKEDLLFSIAEERLHDLRDSMEEQLLGLDDPLSRLKKLVFFRLYYLDKHRNYGRLVLFECRSNMNFYEHRAFDQAKWIMATLGDILRQGMKQGVFRNNLDIRLVRDAVFGLMDLTNMNQLRSKESSHQTDFEAIMDLVGPMVLAPKASESGSGDKRARILSAAETVFADKGYAGATIQDIARAAGVGDGTVYDYFKNKEDLLFKTLSEGFKPSSLKKGFQDHLNDSEGNKAQDPVQDLKRFIRRHFLISLTQPSFAKIFILNGIYNKDFYGSEAGSAVAAYMDRLKAIFTQGKDKGAIRRKADLLTFERLILGAFSHMTLRWLIAEKKAAQDKVGEINTMVDMLIRAAQTPA